jgi:hypothetical protein
MPRYPAVNHGALVDRFFSELLAGSVAGVKAGPALSEDVHALYCAWCAAEGVPQIDAPGKLTIFLTTRHPSIVAVRKRFADGPVVRGPKAILFLASVGQPPRGYEVDWLGAHISNFRTSVADYQRACAEAPSQPVSHA